MSRSPHYQLRSQLSPAYDPNGVSSLVAIPHETDHSWTRESTQDDRSPSKRPVKEIISNRSEKSFRNGLNQGKMDTAKGTTWDSPTLPYLGTSAPSSPALSTASSSHPDSPEGTVLQTHLSRLGPKLRMGKRPPWESPSLDEETEGEASPVSRPLEISTDEYGYTSRPIVSSVDSFNESNGGKDQHLTTGSLRGSNSGTQTLKTLGGRLLRKVRSHAELGGGDNQRRGTQVSSGRGTPCFAESTDSLLGAESDGWKSDTTLESHIPITPVDRLPVTYEDKTPSHQSASQFVSTPPDPMYAGAHRTQPDGQYNAGQNIHDAGWPITPNTIHRPTVLSHPQVPIQASSPDVPAFTQPFRNIGSGLGLISLQEAQAREESNKAAAASRLQQGGSISSQKPTPSPPSEKDRPLSHISEISNVSAYSNFTNTSLTSKGNRRLGAAVPPIPPLWMNTLSEITSPASKTAVQSQQSQQSQHPQHQYQQQQQQQSQSSRMAGFKRQKSGLLRMFEKVSSPALGSNSSGRGVFSNNGATPSSPGDIMYGDKNVRRLDEAAINQESSIIEARPERPASGTLHSPSPVSGTFPMSPLPPLPSSTYRPFSNASLEESVPRPAMPDDVLIPDEKTYGTSTPPLSSSTIQAPFPLTSSTVMQPETPITRSSLSVTSMTPPNLELRPISMDFISGLPATYLTDPADICATNTTSISGFLPELKTSSGKLDVAFGLELTNTSLPVGDVEDMAKKTEAGLYDNTSSTEGERGLIMKIKMLENRLVNEQKQWKLQVSEFENQISELQSSLAAQPTRCATCKGSIERSSVGPAPGLERGPEPEPTFRKQISNMDEGWRVVSGGPIGGGDSVLNRGRMIKPAR